MISWNLEIRQIDDLKGFAKNPRILSEKERHHLSESLDRYGLIDKPIVNQDDTIIGGHQRVAVLREKGETEISCSIPDRLLDEKEVEELNIRLNRNGGEFDFDILANVFEIGDLLDWGFGEEELGLGRADKPKKEAKPVITLEFSDKDTMLDYIQKCEEIAQLSSAKMKVRG